MSSPTTSETEEALHQILHGGATEVSSLEEDTINEVTASLVVDCHCLLGEGVVYDEKRNCILWTDILGKKFHKLPLSSDESSNKMLVETYDLPKMLCSFGMLSRDDGGYLCAWEDCFQLYNLETNEAMSEPSAGEPVTPLGQPTRLNDGRCDRSGEFYICGGFYGDVEGNKVKVFKCFVDNHDDEKKQTTLKHEVLVPEIEVTNAICFSPDGETMYLADSPTKKINRYDYKDGTISNPTLLYETPKGVPDGAGVDSDGYVWNACWRGGAGPSYVTRLDPTTGKSIFKVNMPDETSQVSCCCFGGPNLDILFITTAGIGRDDEPHAGGLYAVKLGGVKGLPESRFDF